MQKRCKEIENEAESENEKKKKTQSVIVKRHSLSSYKWRREKNRYEQTEMERDMCQ